LKLASKVFRLISMFLSESDFQQIKDWNFSRYYSGAYGTPSESDFQQIKDWNSFLPPKVHDYLQSESDFQQIKDWNSHSARFKVIAAGRLNPTSNKSRIETRMEASITCAKFASESDFQQIKDWNLCASQM